MAKYFFKQINTSLIKEQAERKRVEVSNKEQENFLHQLQEKCDIFKQDLRATLNGN